MASWTSPWCQRVAAKTARRHSAVEGLIPSRAGSWSPPAVEERGVDELPAGERGRRGRLLRADLSLRDNFGELRCFGCGCCCCDGGGGDRVTSGRTGEASIAKAALPASGLVCVPAWLTDLPCGCPPPSGDATAGLRLRLRCDVASSDVGLVHLDEGGVCAEAERAALADTGDRRPGRGLDGGDALPLARLSPMTRTRSRTDTPCSSGGTLLSDAQQKPISTGGTGS